MSNLRDPCIEAALAAERRGRFLAEARHARRIQHVVRDRGCETTVSRGVIAQRDRVVTGSARLGSWAAMRRLYRLSMQGES